MALTFVAFVPKMESQIMPPVIPFPPPSLHPLCLSQLALVSYACAMLPPTTTPPPSPLTSPPSPSSPSDDEGHRNDQNHGHHQTSQEENCCRWAKEMDNQCVCEFLLLLPPFLTRPLHQYSISIGESWIDARRVALLMIDLDDFEFEEEEDDSSMEEDPKMYEDYPRRESIHGGESQDV
ncbi:hypothetical protein JHK87_004036 [Glycine soja]|nr:hypothetical protein JHK87_004036 [Glycine soja]